MRSDLTRAAPLFAALGDQTRLQLVARLGSGGPQSISRLAAESVVTRQAVTKHLHALEAAGIARSRRSGRESVWELRPAGLTEAKRYLDQIAAQWDTALARLRRMVEDADHDREP